MAHTRGCIYHDQQMSTHVEHNAESFTSLITTVADRIFPVELESDNMNVFRDEFIRTALSETGVDILSQSFTSEVVNTSKNYSVPAFRGDKLMSAILADYGMTIYPNITKRQLNELNVVAGDRYGQTRLFREYDLSTYFHLGLKVDMKKLPIHFHSSIVEAFIDAIYQIGEIVSQGLGYSIVSNLLFYHLNQFNEYDAERMWDSWGKQLEDNIGKTYIPVGKNSDEKVKHFKLRTHYEGDKTIVTITMDEDSAQAFNNSVDQSPVLHFEGMEELTSKTVSYADLDSKRATSEAYRLMVQHFNDYNYNFNWRLMMRRVNTLKKMAGRHKRYSKQLNRLIQSGMFHYAAQSKEYTLDSLLVVRMSYLQDEYNPNEMFDQQLAEQYHEIEVKSWKSSEFTFNPDNEKYKLYIESILAEICAQFYDDNKQLVDSKIEREKERQLNIR